MAHSRRAQSDYWKDNVFHWLDLWLFYSKTLGELGRNPALPVDSTHWTRALSGAGAARRRERRGACRHAAAEPASADGAEAEARASAAAALARECGHGRGTEDIPW